LTLVVVAASIALMAPSCSPKLSPDWAGTVRIDRQTLAVNEAASCAGALATTYARVQVNATSMATWASDRQLTTCGYFAPQPGGGLCTFLTQVEAGAATDVGAELIVTKDAVGPGYHVAVDLLDSGTYLGQRANLCFSLSYDASLQQGPFDIPLAAPDPQTGGWSNVVIDLCATGVTFCDPDTVRITATVDLAPIA